MLADVEKTVERVRFRFPGGGTANTTLHVCQSLACALSCEEMERYGRSVRIIERASTKLVPARVPELRLLP